jgi:Predicted membrane protein
VIKAVRHFRHRPALSTALAVMIGMGVATGLYFRWTTSLLIGWDVGIVVYVVLVLSFMNNASVISMKHRARLLDRGKWVDLIVAMLAAIASLVAIIAELLAAKGTPTEPFSAGLAGVTVLLSWSFVHFFFAQQYAHDYWLKGHGLDFPGNDSPTYGEFLYFSFTIGMTAQVSDVTTRSATMRRIVLLHGLLSFLFNTAVLAFSINLAAGLAG